jgi:ABC-2 type transport system ATP-binding protein
MGMVAFDSSMEMRSRMGLGILIDEVRKVYSVSSPKSESRFFRLNWSKRSVKDKSSASQNAVAQIVALDSVSLTIKPGEVFGLLGPNGAGKSTLVGILTTRVSPTRGRVMIGDYEIPKDQVPLKQVVGVVQQQPNLDIALTGREILTFHAGYFCVPRAQARERAKQLLDEFDLTNRADEFVRGFSGGMKQRLAIARALMHDPDVLFLDEPSTGLDPQTRLRVWEIIRHYNREGKTILLSTHNMHEAEELCSRIAIIDHGKVIVCGTAAELKGSIANGYVLRVQFSADSPLLTERLQRLYGVTEVRQPKPLGFDIYSARRGALISEICAVAAECSVDVRDVQVSETDLETLFLHHTGRSLRP